MTNSAVSNLVVMFLAVTCIAGQTSKGSAAQGQHNQQLRPPAQLQQEVRCPVAEARTEITTPLPKPWWVKPQLGKLQAVDIQVIGGQKTLVCRYSAYATLVNVMRPFPEGTHECSASGDHFVCR